MKRKMLSMNSSVSAPVVSRNYSAMVRADRATRKRAPGGSFIWPKTMHGLLDDAAAGVADLGFLHFQPEVVAFAGPLADAGEHRVTAVLAGDAGDQFVRMTVLPRPAPPNRPALPPRTNGVSRSMTLMPVSNSSVLGDRSVERRRLAMDRPVLVGVDRAAAVDRLAEQVEHAAQRLLADRHGTGPPVSTHSMPRTRPSVVPRATQRTRLPPRCCCTSPVRWILTPLWSRVDLDGVVDRRAGGLRRTRRRTSSRSPASRGRCSVPGSCAVVALRGLTVWRD